MQLNFIKKIKLPFYFLLHTKFQIIKIVKFRKVRQKILNQKKTKVFEKATQKFMIFLEIFLYYNYFINKVNSLCFLLFFTSFNSSTIFDFGIINMNLFFFHRKI